MKDRVSTTVRVIGVCTQRRMRVVVVLMVVFAGFAGGAHRALAASPSIAADPPSFGSGQIVTISGDGFTPGASVPVWYDGNDNGTQESNEPSTTAG